MKININIEAIVREEVRNFIRETLIINNVPGDKVEVTINTKRMTNSGEASKWEYGRKNGRRRTIEEIALHALEKKYGRLLTPEEKGEAKAFIQVDEDTELKAKENTLTKIRIDGMVTEGLAAASKELAEEEEDLEVPQDEELSEPASKEPSEATIPKTQDLKLNSLFS